MMDYKYMIRLSIEKAWKHGLLKTVFLLRLFELTDVSENTCLVNGFRSGGFNPKSQKYQNIEKFHILKSFRFYGFRKKSKISKYQKYQISIKISKYHDILQNIMIFSILGTYMISFCSSLCSLVRGGLADAWLTGCFGRSTTDWSLEYSMTFNVTNGDPPGALSC